MWHSDANTNASTGRPVAETTKETIGTKLSHHNFEISRNNFGHLEEVHSNVRQQLGRQQGDDMVDIDVNAMICGIVMSATLEAAVDLGQDNQENLRTTKKTDFEKVKTLFDILQKLILTQKNDIFGIPTIEWKTIPWMRTILLHDRAVKLSKAKVHVYSDLALCLSKIHEYHQSIEAWKQNIELFTMSPEYRELDSIYGEPVELEENRNHPGSSKIEPSSCQCTTTSMGEESKTKKFVFRIL